MHFTTSVISTLALATSVSASIPRPWDMKRTPLYPAPPAAANGEFGGKAGQIQSRTWGAASNGSAPPPPPASNSSNPADQVTVVSVGKNGQLAFDPPNVQVPVGSHVQFQFYPESHSVVQASFDNPCVPINNVDKTVKGFFSGFMPAASTPNTLVFDYKVTTADPVWFYCSRDTHCQGGMVGAINA
jgi:plastocyanin